MVTSWTGLIKVSFLEKKNREEKEIRKFIVAIASVTLTPLLLLLRRRRHIIMQVGCTTDVALLRVKVSTSRFQSST